MRGGNKKVTHTLTILQLKTLFFKCISMNDQWEERNLFCKTMTGLFIIVFMSNKFLLYVNCWNWNGFFRFAFDNNFLKNGNFILKIGVKCFNSLQIKRE